MNEATAVIVGMISTIVVLTLCRILSPALFRTLFHISFTGGASVSNVTANCVPHTNSASGTATLKPNAGCTIIGLYAIAYDATTNPPTEYPGGGTHVINPGPVLNATWNNAAFQVATPGTGNVIVAVWPEYKTTDTYTASMSFGPCTL